MSRSVNRRRFLQTTAVASVGYWAAGGVQAQESKSSLERIRFACIGVDGKGRSDSDDAARYGDIVAICDVDEQKLASRARGGKFSNAAKFTDYRKLLETVGKDIDAVTVSTADHTHAPAAAMAMRMGKHAFVQKPLTHTIHEARTLGEIAREKKLATQMGNQGTSERGLREAAALLRGGLLGAVKEVHVWTNRPIWAQGGDRPSPRPEGPPKHLNWDAWLGPAKERPYADGYHPFSWRGWWDFGTGALGDMACHTLNMPFAGLHLRDPIAVQATTSGHNRDSYPKWSIIDFDFAATDSRGPIKLRWYDGGKLPPKELFEGFTGAGPKNSGSLVIGEKGKLYSPDDYGAQFFVAGVEKKAVEIERSPGHFFEWVRAMKGGPPAMSNFPDYAGPLTETILLGNLAVWAANEKETPGKKIDWDAKNLTAKNAPEVAHIVKKEYRKGYSV